MVVSPGTSEKTTTPSEYGLFVRDLKEEMETEFQQLNTSSDELCYENYLVYKSAFSQISEHSRVYRSLLLEIQNEFDQQISLAKKLSTASSNSKNNSVPSQINETLGNLQMRKKQLDKTIAMFQSDNIELTQSIQSIRELVADASSHSLVDEDGDDTKNAILKGMTLEQMTNVNLLSRELGKLQHEHQQLLESQATDFVSKDKFAAARAQLLEKEDRKELLHERIVTLHHNNPALRLLIDTLNNMTGSSFEDILAAAQSALKTPLDSSGHLDMFDDEDPVKEKEAEMILAYVEHFEELMRDKNYSGAAIHAANSPNGILRTMATMNEFKNLSATDDGLSPWLQYCRTLMSTVEEFGVPNEEECVECVECALKEGRTDYIAQWIANNTLQLSRVVGDTLLCHCACRTRCVCSCGPLAQEVFRALGDDDQLIYCLAKQGALYRALHHANNSDISNEQLVTLLTRVPSVELATLLVLEHGINLGTVLQSLHSNHHDNITVGILRTLNDPVNTLSQMLICDRSGPEVEWSEILDVCSELGEDLAAQEVKTFLEDKEAYASAVELRGSGSSASSNKDDIS